jgi:hypothetical protein
MSKKSFPINWDLPLVVVISLPVANQALAGITALKKSEMGVLFCGGKIGREGQMGVAVKCSMVSHLKNKCWEKIFGLETLSDAMPTKDTKKQSVHIVPSLSSELLNETYLTSSWSVSSWAALFLSLNILKEEQDEMVE